MYTVDDTNNILEDVDNVDYVLKFVEDYVRPYEVFYFNELSLILISYYHICKSKFMLITFFKQKQDQVNREDEHRWRRLRKSLKKLVTSKQRSSSQSTSHGTSCQVI